MGLYRGSTFVRSSQGSGLDLLGMKEYYGTIKGDPLETATCLHSSFP